MVNRSIAEGKHFLDAKIVKIAEITASLGEWQLPVRMSSARMSSESPRALEEIDNAAIRVRPLAVAARIGANQGFSRRCAVGIAGTARLN